MDLKIFTDMIEPEATNQIYRLLAQPAFSDCKVRIMPDVHAGAGCVIGFTADLGNKVIPNIVGVDIGCGMLTTEIPDADVDLEKLDKVIRNHIPSGYNIHGGPYINYPYIKELYCYEELKYRDRFERSICTLGGGNHFIEVDEHPDGRYFLVIHTGSRNLGKQVAEYYQKKAVELMYGKDSIGAQQQSLINELKAAGRENEIEAAIKTFRKNVYLRKTAVPEDLCYLEGVPRLSYLHDMLICQEYAASNRSWICTEIFSRMGWAILGAKSFETVHNYIDIESNIVRKGAVSAKEGERLLIPINMRDGCLLCRGKGNPDWNYSAPHGAGRLMSRRRAKEAFSLDQYRASMEGVYTTSVGFDTIDEAPMAYKPIESILENIKDTVEVEAILKPIYNFKAGGSND